MEYKSIQEVRELIFEDYNNQSKKNLSKIELIDKNKLDLPTRLIRFFYLNDEEEIKKAIPTITKAIYNEIFKELSVKSSDNDIYKKIKNLVNLFSPACDTDKAQRILEYTHYDGDLDFNYLRCQGQYSPDTHLISYEIEYTKEVNGVNTGEVESHPVERTYFSEKYIRCPRCKMQNVEIKLFDGKRESYAICKEKDCLFKMGYTKEDIYWCFSSKCTEPCAFQNNKPKDKNDLTINHILGDVHSITYLSTWFNRLLRLLPNCYCNSCERILVPIATPNKNKSPNAYGVLYYKCINEDCVENNSSIYLNHCSNKKCTALIDSRVNKQQCDNNFKICDHCYGCCNQKIFDIKGWDKQGHLEQNKIFCPDCSNFMMLSKFDDYKFYCTNCKKSKQIRQVAHRAWYNWKGLQNKIGEMYNEGKKGVISSIYKGPLN